MTSTTASAPQATAPRRRAVDVHPVSISRVIRSEWIKLWTLRSTWLTYAIGVLGAIGISYLVSYETRTHWSQIEPRERLFFDPTQRSLAGVFLAQLAIGVLGVLIVTSEYSTGTVRATFAAVPKRLPVLLAKAVSFAAITLILTEAMTFVAFLGGQALLHPHNTSLGASHVLRAVIGAGLYLVVVGLFGMGLGAIIRSTPAAIATLFGLLLVLPGIMNLLPNSWQRHISPYLPSNAGQDIFTLHPDPGSLAPWAGFGVFCLWALAALLVAAGLLVRRDA